MKNSTFQDLWFGVAPGSGKNESELDFQLLAMIFENITQNEEQLKALFEKQWESIVGNCDEFLYLRTETNNQHISMLVNCLVKKQ